MAGKQRVELVKKNIERNGDEKLRKKRNYGFQKENLKWKKTVGIKKSLIVFVFLCCFEKNAVVNFFGIMFVV